MSSVLYLACLSPRKFFAVKVMDEVEKVLKLKNKIGYGQFQCLGRLVLLKIKDVRRLIYSTIKTRPVQILDSKKTHPYLPYPVITTKNMT